MDSIKYFNSNHYNHYSKILELLSVDKSMSFGEWVKKLNKSQLNAWQKVIIKYEEDDFDYLDEIYVMFTIAIFWFRNELNIDIEIKLNNDELEKIINRLIHCLNIEYTIKNFKQKRVMEYTLLHDVN